MRTILGLLIAVVFLVGLPLLFIYSIVTLAQGAGLQEEMDRETVFYKQSATMASTDTEISVAFPSKLYPEKDARALVWATDSSPSSTDIITVSVRINPPLFVQGSETITIPVRPKTLPVLPGEFHYTSLNLDQSPPKLSLAFDFQSSITSTVTSVTVQSLFDTEYVRKRIRADRTWQIIVVLASLSFAGLTALFRR
jgi:hypothetical protein